MTMGARNDVLVGVAAGVAGLRDVKMQSPVGLEQWMIALQPQAEFNQIYRDAWRMMRVCALLGRPPLVRFRSLSHS